MRLHVPGIVNVVIITTGVPAGLGVVLPFRYRVVVHVSTAGVPDGAFADKKARRSWTEVEPTNQDEGETPAYNIRKPIEGAWRQDTDMSFSLSLSLFLFLHDSVAVGGGVGVGVGEIGRRGSIAPSP